MNQVQEALKAELIGAFPPGSEVVIDWGDPDGPGPLLEAWACALSDGAADVLERLRPETCPATAVVNLPWWEDATALHDTRIAAFGTRDQRRAQLLSRLREYDTPTIDNVREVLNAYLQYADQSEIVILEPQRQRLRELHTYAWRGGRALSTTPTSLTWQVLDDAKVSASGAQVDLAITADLTTLTATLVSPDGTTATRTAPSRETRSSGRAWTLQVNPWLPPDSCRALWASPTGGSAWAVGDNGTAHVWDGSTWNATTTGTMEHLRAIWGQRVLVVGSYVTVLWAVGDNGTILAWNGTSWSTQPTPTAHALYAVWGSSVTDIWAAGHNGVILHWNGTMWSLVAGASVAEIHGLWGSGSSNVYAACESGVIQRWDGVAWVIDDNSAAGGQHLNAIWGSGPADIWAVGNNGTTVHRGPAGAWAAVPLGASTHLYAVWGDGTTDGTGTPQAVGVWACGAGGKIYLWNGSEWGAYASTVGNDLYTLAGSDPSDVWAGGDGAALVRFQPTGSGASLRLCFPEFAGRQIAGAWTLTLSLSAGTGSLTGAGLFVEGFGRDSTGRDGRGAAAFYWGVLVEDSKLGAGADLDAARQAVHRIAHARFYATLIRRPLTGGLAAGIYGAIPADVNAIPGACVPH